jgi:DNA-binding PucR family transcriptional regulator
LLTNDLGSINTLFIDEMLARYVEPLISYDRQNATELYQTLNVFFAHNQSYTQTARVLFIHINTLRARLKRVEILLNTDLSQTATLLNLNLALAIHEAQCPT